MSQIPSEIQQVLKRFRRWIRRYILLEGLAVFIVVACLMFWFTFTLDVVYFRLSNLELPSTLRLLLLVGMSGVLSGIAVSWIVLRFFRQFRIKDLALALERKFPQLRDQLITTVEIEQEPTSPLQAEMVDRTRREAAEKVARLPLEEAFDRTPLKRLVIAATVLFSTLAVFSVANAASVERWVHAYLFAEDNYWDPFRKQALSLKVVAQPGERIREFDERGVYRHPRGADLQLLVENQSETEAPDSVIVQYLSLNGNSTERGRVTMSRTGEGRFRHSFARVVDGQRIWIRGGDFVNRTPYHIQIVDPPQVNQLTLDCDYPTYTGMDGMEDRKRPVVGTQVALPMETRFVLQADCNKPLRSVDIRSDRFQLSFGFKGNVASPAAMPTTLLLKDAENRIVRSVEVNAAAGSLFDNDGQGFQIPFLVTASAEQKLAEMGDFLEFPIPIAPDSTLNLFLEDQDDIYSPEPATIMINGIVDKPPVIDSRRTGIGSMVTKNASLPIEGTVTDDYGIDSAWFGYQVGGATSEQTNPLKKQPAGQTEFVLNDESNKRVERFQLRPLRLQVGATFTLGVYAQDGDNLNGPHSAHGELFSFKIVSDDELLGRLIDREVNLRLRFEQIRQEMGDLRELLREQSSKVAGHTDAEIASNTETGTFLERSLHQLRKNHTESRSIEVSFRDLREEMVNNGVDTRDKLERIDHGVIQPMKVLNDSLMAEADKRYALQRLSLQRKSGVEKSLQETLPAIDDVISQMDRILEEMRDRGTINDVILNLQSLIEKQRKVLKEAEEKRIEENFFFDFKE